MSEEKVVQRVPLHWAVSIAVAIVTPLAFFLGDYSLPLWVCFIVWAEYFALGATPSTWKFIIPSIPFGALAGALWEASAVFLGSFIGGESGHFWGTIIGNFIFVTLLVYLLPKVKAWTTGSLAVFNGLTLFLAVYFTGSTPPIGPVDNTYWVIFLAFTWTVLLAYLGWVIGWLNVEVLTFPKKVKVEAEDSIAKST